MSSCPKVIISDYTYKIKKKKNNWADYQWGWLKLHLLLMSITPYTDCCLVAMLCLTVLNPMDCSMPDIPVPHHLLGFAQGRVHCIGDAIQSSHPLLPSSPSALNSSQRQGLFQWAGDFCTKEDSSLKKIFLAASGCIDSLVVLCRLSSCVVRAQLLLSMWDFSSLTRDWTHISWIAMQILNHWTTREVPIWDHFVICLSTDSMVESSITRNRGKQKNGKD